MPDTRPTDGSPLNPRQFLILLVLHDGPMHGYGILKAVEAESDGEVVLDPANLYRTLKLLHRDGLVEEKVPRSGVAGRRRVFALTDAGRRTVKAEAARVWRLAGAVRARRLAPRSEPTP